MRSLAAAGAGTLATLLAAGAHASGGGYLMDGAREAALAGSVVARRGDPSSLDANVAGAADSDTAALALGGSVGALESRFARTGERESRDTRGLASASLALVAPLPAQWGWDSVRFALGLDLPGGQVLRVSVPQRYDAPYSPVYAARSERMAATLAVAWRGGPVRLGAGVALAPYLEVPTEVRYVASRGATPEDDVEVRLERRLHLGFAPLFGARWEVTEELHVGAAYRFRADGGAEGPQRTVAGGILADDPIDYYILWDPAELALGVRAAPRRGTELSLDVAWVRWSEARSAFDTRLAQPLEDVWTPRVGVEQRLGEVVVLRAGYSFEATPVPPQVGDTSYLDADRHVLAAGAGVELEPWLGWPLTADVFGRTHLGTEQRATKDPTALADADPEAPGQQITNLGYPGYRSTTRLLQAGVTLTFRLDREAPR